MPAHSNCGANPLRFRDWYILYSKVKFSGLWVCQRFINRKLNIEIPVKQRPYIEGFYHNYIILFGTVSPCLLKNLS